MEIYAAMIDYLDESIGRVFANLKEIGQYDNTLIIFFSDNGASKTTIEDYAALGGEMSDYLKTFDNSIENRGLPGSSIDIGPGWAYATNTPFRLMKGYVTQGGMQVPSLIPLLKDGSDAAFTEREQGFELYGIRAYIKGDWKALRLPKPYGTGEWQLYNLAQDPGEFNDLAAKYPDKLKALADAWDKYAADNGVVEPNRPVGYAKPPRAGSY